MKFALFLWGDIIIPLLLNLLGFIVILAVLIIFILSIECAINSGIKFLKKIFKKQ